ncbi:MAG TPA: cyclic nucleotide-binding domain-containing protein [Burkholderiales bacterium]|nr:cyclic nucleotide-binding domain-containing protein [Burkholderiales bacterium]
MSDDLDFSQPAQPKPAAKPAGNPAAPAPKPVYNAAMALEFFRAGGKAEGAPAGTKFFVEDEKAGFLKRDKMYLLMEGEVTLSAKGKVIGSVKAGEIFGEMAAISESPRSATAVAKTNCRVTALDDKDFKKALQVKPEFALMLMGMMILRLRGMLARLSQNSLDASGSGGSRLLDKAMVEALAKGLGPDAIVRHNGGTQLFTEGSSGALAYVVQDGRVAVSIKGKLVERVGPGGIFGEMALVDQSVRAASAVAESDVILIAVNRTVFVNLVKANPEFGAALLGAVAERVRFIAARVK